MLAIIIPVFNEEEHLPKLLDQLKNIPNAELIVVDAGSTDQSVTIAKTFGVQLIFSNKRRRSIQLNAGAHAAKANYLLFLHADVQLPDNFKEQIESFMNKKGLVANFSLRFDQKHWLLAMSAYFTKFTFSSVQFGDQGLLIDRKLFHEIGAYDEGRQLIEGQDIIRRVIKRTSLEKLPSSLMVSARKYRKHGVFYLQSCYFLTFVLYRLNWSDRQLNKLLLWLLRKKKNEAKFLAY